MLISVLRVFWVFFFVSGGIVILVFINVQCKKKSVLKIKAQDKVK